MKCTNCKIGMSETVIPRYAFKEYGESGIFLINIKAYVCSQCWEECPIIPNLKGLVTLIDQFKKGDYRFDEEKLRWSWSIGR